MRVNLISLTVQSNNRFVKLHPISEGMAEKAQSTGKSYHANPRYLVLNHREARMAIDCCRGKAEVYPYFDDLTHLIKFGFDGFVEVSLDGTRFERIYFTIPGAFLAALLEDVLENAPTKDNESYTREVHPQTLIDLACDYAPRVAWEYQRIYDYEKHEFTDQTTKDLITKDLANSAQTGLQNSLDGLRRIAVNHSHGFPSVIRINPDHIPDDTKPTSYYWTIYATNRATGETYRVMNGGIIAHPSGENDAWEYSTHT